MSADFGDFKGRRNIYPFISVKAFIIIALFALLACQQVQKPELKGEGPLAVTVARGTATPEYHAPAECWRINHGQAINRGDFPRRECVLCHNPETACNNCHQYVGTPKISIPEASLYWADLKSE